MTTTAQPDSLTRLIEHHAGTKPVPSGPEGLRVCDLPEYLTIKDAADLIDVKPWPIYRVVEQGRVRAFATLAASWCRDMTSSPSMSACCAQEST